MALADGVNSARSGHVVHRIADALNDEARPLRGSRTVVPGVTYKPDAADTRESPPLEVLALPLAKGAEASTTTGTCRRWSSMGGGRSTSRGTSASWGRATAW